VRALIMAGGAGKRLHPLTQDLPKPLLRVRGKPILEHLLLRLRHAHVDDVTLAVAHLASKLEAHFSSGENHGLRISYLREDFPLGTAGALGILERFEETILMTNADILTDLDFGGMLAQHRHQGAVLTVASQLRHTQISLGVLEVGANGMVSGYVEKPRLEHRVGIGIYAVNPEVKTFIPPNRPFDMPDVINALVAAGEKVGCYDHTGNWIDIGTPEEYSRAEEHSWLGADLESITGASA
jgi:NDP-sugar pyrophosphorylase family protein